MAKGIAEKRRLTDLRKQAEARRDREAMDIPAMSTEEVGKLVHELRTHQIELEMQNEELRRAQEELVESRDRYSDLYDFAPVGYVTVSRKGLILEANLTLADMLGVERQALLRQPLSAFIIPDDQDRYYRHRRQLLESKQRVTCQLRMLRRDAKPFWAEVDSIMVETEDESDLPYRAIISDITERRKTMEQLVASDQRRKEAQRIASLGSWELTAEDELSWSGEVFDIFGVDREQFDGTTGIFYDRVHPDDRELVSRATAEALETKQPYDFVHRITRPDGQIRIVRERAEVVCDPAGTPIKLMGTVQDITKLKDVEEQLRQAQKMESIGQLTGGVAHDFNNLLSIVMGNTEFMSRQLGRDDPRVQAVLRATRRGASLVQQLLAFSRKQPLHPRVLNLNMLVQDMQEISSRSLGETIEVRTTLEDGLWRALADPIQVETALLNLAINARDAMPDGGSLVIETGNTRLSETNATEHPEVAAGDYVMLAVTDSGKGMAPHVVEHAFEPFFTTKEVGQGTGLGLSMVYGFAKQSGGHAVIYSEPGHGTTVKLYLPRTEGKVETFGQEEGEAPHGRGETVLVVEDDADVRQFAEHLLEDLDYRVFTAKDGHTALGILEHIPQPDLLLSDVVLPNGVSGPDLAKRVLELYPSLKIIFMSGYPANAAKGTGLVESGEVLLGKPFSRLQIARAMRKALDH